MVLAPSRDSRPGAVLAERLEVSVRTLRRDIDRLRELGYPVEAERGVDGGYQLAAGAVLPPLLLDDEEAVALAVGLHTAVQGGTVAGIAESSLRALTKVTQVMPPRLRRRVDALGAMTVPATWGGAGPLVDPVTLTSMAQACRDSERLKFTYTARDGQQTARHVEPHRLVLLGRRWYLVAYDLTRQDWRSFRLDRVGEARATGSGYFRVNCRATTPPPSSGPGSTTCQRLTPWKRSSMPRQPPSASASAGGGRSRTSTAAAAGCA